MTGPHFVDANVLVYARDPREPVKQLRAAAWIAHLWRERAGRTSAQVLSEYYTVATRKLSPRVEPEVVWDDVTRYFAWDPQPVDEVLMRRAREVERRYQLSWWDAMVVAAAQEQDCRILLTEDLQDGMMFGSVKVRDPFLHTVEEPEVGYAAAPSPRSLHRPRGRPRRALAHA